MFCPFCGAADTKVIDSRLVSDGAQVRRRRECGACHERYTTYEVAELLMPRIIKSDNVREAFLEDKVRSGFLKALEKRPIELECIERSVNNIKQQLRATGEREIPSRMVGDLVMEELKALDQVAYVRFASVYRSFQDIEEFNQEIEKLQSIKGE